MKAVILFSTLVASIVGLNSCKKETTDAKILVNFINRTGAEIKSATADDTQIGTIENNGQTGFVDFQKFGTDTEMPDCNFVGLYNNDTLKSTSKFYWCGTQKSQLKPGQYNIEVKLSTMGSEKYFDLRFK